MGTTRNRTGRIRPKSVVTFSVGILPRATSKASYLDKIHKESQEVPDFLKASKGTIQGRLKKLGFVCKERNKKIAVYQRLEVVANGQRVLRQFRKLRVSGYKILHQHETWCNPNHTREYVWQTDSDPDDLLRQCTSHITISMRGMRTKGKIQRIITKTCNAGRLPGVKRRRYL